MRYASLPVPPASTIRLARSMATTLACVKALSTGCVSLDSTWVNARSFWSTAETEMVGPFEIVERAEGRFDFAFHLPAVRKHLIELLTGRSKATRVSCTVSAKSSALEVQLLMCI